MRMLTKLFSKAEPPPAAKPRWDVASVAAVLKQFPIGSRVLYFPESKKELRLESIVLGCNVNRRFVFSQGQIELRKDAGGDYLWISGEEGDHSFREIHSFYLLIPHQVRSEIDCGTQEPNDPSTRLYQKDVNDFAKDSLITLICYSPYGRVPHIETVVKSVSALQGGFYANHRAVLLDPFLSTLTEVDQRRHHRVSTRIPLALRSPGDEAPIACTMEDFSERFVRVRLAESGADAEKRLSSGARLLFTLNLADRGKPFVLQGVVRRKTRSTVVIELKALLKEGRFADFQLVDQLAFKAALLDHPATQAALRKAKPAA